MARVVILDIALWVVSVLFAATVYPRLPGLVGYALAALLGAAMVLWRVLKLAPHRDTGGADIPYTCGFAAADGRELFVVGTLHISPRAPEDVHAVIANTSPDMAMIELDEERLDDMRAPPPLELQTLTAATDGLQPATLQAQRAVWNGDRGGEIIAGLAVVDDQNPYGLETYREAIRGKIVVVLRGPPNQFAPFALKAHRAASAGALGVLVINNEGDSMPQQRLGVVTLTMDLKVALRARSLSLPSAPLFLLSHEDGEPLRRALLDQPGSVHIDLQVLEDTYPRRSVARQLCQTMVLVLSGLIVLYEIVECCSVDVGGEFMAAERAAAAQQIPCQCIDVDTDRLCARIWMLVRPTPRNIAGSLLGWLAFPRSIVKVCFPACNEVDVLGSFFLHLKSFRRRTWCAFLVATICSAAIANFTLLALSTGTASAAEGSGAVDHSSVEDAQAYIMLGIEAYVMPRLYEAVSASRDEAMYQSIVTNAREHSARRLVVVVGAAHANGILRRARERGL